MKHETCETCGITGPDVRLRRCVGGWVAQCRDLEACAARTAAQAVVAHP